MKNTLKYLVLAGFASIAMTGCPAAETTCETNEDCADGEVCSADLVCETETTDDTCTDNSECTVEGEVCLPTADDATVSACAAPSNCSEAADPAAFCTAELGADATCNTDADPVCEASPTVETRYVQILDASEGGSCDSTSGAGPDNADPGSDIMYVQALSGDGDLLGYGKFVDFTEGSNDNAAANGYNTPDVVFTGDAPDLGDDDCPVEMGNGNKFRADSVVSLGCGGELVVEFTDATDITAILQLAAGQQVDVGEFGPYCTNPDSGEGSDRYSVYLCETTIGADPAEIDFDTECLIELGVDASGQSAFDVPAPE